MEMQPTATYDYEGPPSANQSARIQNSPCNMQRSTTTDSNFYTNLDPEPTTSGQGENSPIPQNSQLVNRDDLKQVKKSMRFIKACLIGMIVILLIAVTIFSLVSTKVNAITTSKESEVISNLKDLIHILTGNQKKISFILCQNGGSFTTTGGLIHIFLSPF